MIDMETYKRMHPSQISDFRADLEKETMEQDDPPLGDRFYMCLPVHIIGFNMQNKEWGRESSGVFLHITETAMLTQISKTRGAAPGRCALE
jgi:hypothetical protein